MIDVNICVCKYIYIYICSSLRGSVCTSLSGSSPNVLFRNFMRFYEEKPGMFDLLTNVNLYCFIYQIVTEHKVLLNPGQ